MYPIPIPVLYTLYLWYQKIDLRFSHQKSGTTVPENKHWDSLHVHNLLIHIFVTPQFFFFVVLFLALIRQAELPEKNKTKQKMAFKDPEKKNNSYITF
jgi:hypothetical protein